MSQLRNRTSQYREPQRVKALGYYSYFRELESAQDAEVVLGGKKVLMFGSNSYLGLTNHPVVKEATIKAIEKYGSGSGGSRFLNGTMDIHVELEERMAKFLGKEAALAYSTGFQVNIGVIPTITGTDDFILCDRNNHASIIEGSRLSKAKTLFFKHNDMQSLEKKLQYCPSDAFKLIVVDGVFSMEGDIANLPEIVLLAKQYNATVMSDCAHGVGVIGKQGRGTSSHFGLTDDVELIGGTFSKSMASLGGFIASDIDTINFIKHQSRAFIFSASMTPASVASVIAALDILESDDSVLDRLWENTDYAKNLLLELGFDIGASETPILPIYVKNYDKTFQLSQKLLERGVFVNTVVPPAVNPNDSLVRFSLMATHTKEQISEAIEKIHDIATEIGLMSEMVTAD
ncbi:MAG: pyridoxal phosphate-dependent aminotransferase family protein [Cytophagales bacterium]|nr:pyridoxal phosphate-dependent aminotransferase family protein [Cytophagales bacterium]